MVETRKSILQGDPNQNLKFVLAMILKVCISDPMLLKPKCVWEAVVFFNFRKNFQLFVYNFSKKAFTSQTHFGFNNIGSEMHIFRVIAKTNFEFCFGSPCILFYGLINDSTIAVAHLDQLLSTYFLSFSKNCLTKNE